MRTAKERHEMSSRKFDLPTIKAGVLTDVLGSIVVIAAFVGAPFVCMAISQLIWPGRF